MPSRKFYLMLVALVACEFVLYGGGLWYAFNRSEDLATWALLVLAGAGLLLFVLGAFVAIYAPVLKHDAEPEDEYETP